MPVSCHGEIKVNEWFRLSSADRRGIEILSFKGKLFQHRFTGRVKTGGSEAVLPVRAAFFSFNGPVCR
ncbi:hypothetical protein M2418_001819 [Rhizobium sp. BIGb0125]|nr:hypothetical protein [Rhizobium sp. BIGb0125]